MRSKRPFTVIALAAACTLLLAACGQSNPAPKSSLQVQRNEVTDISNTLLRLERAEPPAKPSDSSNLRVQNAWYTAEADPTKIWYGELLSASGTLIKAYVTQGPAVDASDEVTNPLQATWRTDTNCDNCASIAGVGIGLAEPDGTYDTTSPELIFIGADGTIGRIWVGGAIYLQQDRPFITTQTPLLSENLSVAPSHTDTSTTLHPLVPSAVSVPGQ